jgi:hypothetical protein
MDRASVPQQVSDLPADFTSIELDLTSLDSLPMPVADTSLIWASLRTGIVMDLFTLVRVESS